MKAAACLLAVLTVATYPHAETPLRVCADPNNLPYTNSAGEGFENKLAALVARDQGATLEYTWRGPGRGFIRETLNAGRCDVVMGLPRDANLAATTEPYYRSTYVFVVRRDAHFRLRSLDDPALKTLRIGVQLVNEDDSSPPALSLSRRGIVRNVKGYGIYGEGNGDVLVSAVAKGQVDVAAAWGPQAGYFAARQAVPIDLVPVTPRLDAGFLPQTFAISMAVRHGDSRRLRMLNGFIRTHRRQIARLLADYHVPLVPEGGGRR